MRPSLLHSLNRVSHIPHLPTPMLSFTAVSWFAADYCTSVFQGVVKMTDNVWKNSKGVPDTRKGLICGMMGAFGAQRAEHVMAYDLQTIVICQNVPPSSATLHGDCTAPPIS